MRAGLVSQNEELRAHVAALLNETRQKVALPDWSILFYSSSRGMNFFCVPRNYSGHRVSVK
jgi:hypothetical protein